MQTTITLSDDGKKYVFAGPYNAASNARYHLLGGKWKGKKWHLPADAKTAEFIREFFGEGHTDTVIQVALDSQRVTPFDSQIVLGGYVLAGRMFGKGKVHLGDGVRLVSGTFDLVSPDGIPRVSWHGPAPVVELSVRFDYAHNNGLYSVPVPDELKREPEPSMSLEPRTDGELEELFQALRIPGWQSQINSLTGEVSITKDKTDNIITVSDADVMLLGTSKLTLQKRKSLVWRALEIISSINAQNQ